MRHGLNFKIVLFVFISSSFLAISGSAQSDWTQKMRDLRDKGTPQVRLEFLEKALKEAPDAEHPMLLMEKALIYEAQGKFTEALAIYAQVLKTPGNLAEYAHLFSARLHLQAGREERAQFHFERILDLSPNVQLQNESKYELARLALKQNKASEARRLLSGLERHQRSEGIYPDLLWELARAERGLGNHSAACKWLKKLFIVHPESAHLANWGSDLTKQTFEGKPSLCPMSNDDRKKRIKNLQWAGSSKRAWDEIQDLKKLSSEDPFEITMLEALYHLHEGEVSDALNLLLPFYEKKKSNFNYLTTLATTAARAGEVQLAVGTYYTAYKSSPRSKLGKQALYQSAFLSYQFQDYDGASRRFQEFMKVYSNSGLAKDARWHLAWIRYLRGDYDGALKAFQDLKNMASRGRRRVASQGNDRLAYWTAMTLFRQGRYNEAKAGFEGLAKDSGQGFYALASQQRLHKIEGLLPKPMRPVLTERTKSLTRFSATEFMVSMDDFEKPRWSEPPQADEAESEENLALNPLSSATELATEAPAEEDESATATTTDQTHLEVADDGGAESKSSFSNPVLVKRFERARDLTALGLTDWARWDLYDIERRTTNKAYLKDLINQYEAIEQYHRSATIAQNAFASLRSQYGLGGVRSIWQHAYPQAYKNQVLRWSSQFQVSSELIWGIMKAESSYRRDVVSPVGAIGLMQIMPGTGDKISGLLKEKGFSANMLYEPDTSVRLGAKYLQRLMKQFDQNYALVAAGYNAGPHRVRSWLASFGQLDLDEFIEHIPFLETRNYVKRVVSNAWVYNQLYGGPKDFFGTLTEPLKIRFQTLVPTKETWEDI